MSRDSVVLDLSKIGPVCVHCGTPNPDHGDKCGNCEEDPFVHNENGNNEYNEEELLTFNPKQQKFVVALS